jgi:hypothetical protein
MRQVTVQADILVTGTTYSTQPVIIDQYISPNAVTYSKVGNGTVQVSTTDPYPVVAQNFTTASFTWVTAPTGAPNADGFLGQPFRAIRLTGATGGDSLTVIQAGVR